MKCDELTPIDLECNMGPDVNGVVQREPWKAYDIDEVDAAIAEIKEENESLLQQNRELCQSLQVMYSKEEYGKLQKEIESLKASHYAEMVDAGMRERRLKRALWMARANRARAKQIYYDHVRGYGWMQCLKLWRKVEHKCRAKAEEYK